MSAFLRSALATALVLFALSGPEASAFKLTPKTGVAAGAAAGAGWSLKKNIGKMTDRLSSMLGDAADGRGDKLREHEAWFEETGGRLVVDANPALSLPKRALEVGKEKLAAAKRKVKRFSKWAGDRRAALAVGKKDRNFLESETGILGRQPLPQPKAAPAAARARDTNPWGAGKESRGGAARQPAGDCWMATGGRACPARAASPWDEEPKTAGGDPWGSGAERANAEPHPKSERNDGNAQGDYETALNRKLGDSVGGIVEDMDYDSMLAALEEKEAAQKRAEEAELTRKSRRDAEKRTGKTQGRQENVLASNCQRYRAAIEQFFNTQARYAIASYNNDNFDHSIVKAAYRKGRDASAAVGIDFDEALSAAMDVWYKTAAGSTVAEAKANVRPATKASKSAFYKRGGVCE